MPAVKTAGFFYFMQKYLQLNIPAGSEEQKAILIARLDEVGFQGFEEQQGMLKAFIPEENFEEEVVNEVLKDENLEYSIILIEAKNWNEEWEKNFEPIAI